MSYSYKQLRKEFTPEELAESFVFPVKLSAKKQKEADLQLAAAIKKTQAEMTDEDRLALDLLGLRFRMENYYQAQKTNLEYSFRHFLKLYIQLQDKKRREFAAEIGIDETLLSQLINKHRTPPDYMAIRLELHSNNSIPAQHWFRVIEKDREVAMLSNMAAMRKKERKHVKGGIGVKLKPAK